MNLRLIGFLIVQFAVAIVAVVVDNPNSRWTNFVFAGVLSAQFALLGIWFGIGSQRLATRFAITLIGVIGLSAVAITQSTFNGWLFLFELVRLPICAVAYSSIRRRRNVVLCDQGELAPERLFQVTLKQLFGITFGLAVFLAFGRFAESYSGDLYGLLLIVFVLLLGIGGTLVPLVASLASFSHRDTASAIMSTCVILSLAAAIAVHTYSQTNSWQTAAQWFATSLMEAIVVATVVFALRQRGYRLRVATH